MLKVLKNLKESTISVIIIVMLLILQATCDLTLPDYTSKIINVGIQNGGIEEVAPEVIRKETIEKILLFTEQGEAIKNSYEEITKDGIGENQYEKIKKKYAVIEKETLYKIKKLTKEEKQKINSIMAKPLMIISYLENEEMAIQMKQQMLAEMPVEIQEQQKNAMANMELIDIFKQIPEEQLKTTLSKINEQINSMEESIIEQAAIQQVRKEYKNMGVNTDNLQNTYIITSGLKMLGISLIIMVSAISIMLLSARVGARLARTLREKVFKKVLRFSNKEFTEYSTASLITRSTNDIQQIQNLIGMLFRVIVYAPIIGVGGFLRVLRQSDNSMAWIIGVAILAVLIVIGTLFIIAMPKFKILQKLIDKVNLVAREILTGIPVIRAFNTEKKEEKRFDIANTNLTKTDLFVTRAMSFMMPALMLIMNCISLLIVWVGAHGVDNGTMQVGNMMAFIQYTMQIVMSFLMISMMSIILPRASVSANRINEVLDTEEFIKESKEPKQLNPNKKGLVEFKNVGFKYPDSDEEVLSDITFTAKPGETTAIIGSTGSGKSTVVNLIPRFYDITSGNLLIDGIDIKDISNKDLRKIIGFVPQKGILFSGTIESNIKYGNPEMLDEQMIEAAQIAQAEEFIEAKPLKYQEPISQGGSNVSGGQKQRLSIARAIAIDPEIIVFDDSFSALDFKTDSILRAELSKKTKDKTVIIVAQRINTIINADQIIVLEDGKVVGKGTHEELIKNNETYKQIALSQLSEEELNTEKRENRGDINRLEKNKNIDNMRNIKDVEKIEETEKEENLKDE